MFLYLVTFLLQLIRPKVELITIVTTIALKQYLVTFKLQLLCSAKLNCNHNWNYMKKCHKLYSVTLLQLLFSN